MIAADGREVEGGAKLMTCALRCAGIYGEGEQRHLPRIVVGGAARSARSLVASLAGGKRNLASSLAPPFSEGVRGRSQGLGM